MEDTEQSSPLAAVAAGAAAILKGIWLFTLATALSAVLLWGWLFTPFAFSHWWSAALAVAILLLLFSPAAVLLAAAITVRQLAYLPQTLAQKSKQGRDHLASVTSGMRPGAYVSKKRRVWNLGRALFDLWALVVDSKAMLLQYAGMVRLANPISLIVVGAAAVTGVVLIMAAGISLAVSAMF